MSKKQKLMKALLIFPHQLDREHEALHDFENIIMVEEHLFFTQYPFHKQKIAFHRASMKAFREDMKYKEFKYIPATDDLHDIRVLIPKLREDGYNSLGFIDPVDDWLQNRVIEAAEKANIIIKHYEASLFINQKKDLEPYFRSDKKKFFQTKFYKNERERLGVLLDENGKPEGGKWTYDTENRKKYPKGKNAPSINFPKSDELWSESVEYVKEHFSSNYGDIDLCLYPYTVEESEKWLQQFLEYRFAEFGPYEDAIVKEESFLHHSVLTPMLNVGLLKPTEVIDTAISFAKENKVPIQSMEGFIRQIMGWREFMRGMYHAKGVEMRTKNFWGFERKIPKEFYTGETGITPIDNTIKKLLKTGYCHHIERLMVLGNFMVLCEFDPDEVYQWFMELFIDSYDWVMVPNVYAMSQFADGGLFATKPYISSSNYIKKMSNYSSGDWEQIWDGLFWRFMHKQRSFFKGNPRLGMLLNNLNKMGEEKLTSHLSAAEEFLNGLK